ncbi:MAG: alpha/beta fold hydrolase [Caulobacteraceae bacterium]
MQTFRSGGLEIAYQDIPAAGAEVGTAVLVHGFATNSEENWRRLGWFGAFERKGYRILALDLRGHGASEKPHDPEPYDRAAMAGDIIALMDFVGVQRADLFGYSLGAHLSAQAAAAEPERFTSLILGGVGERALTPRPERSGRLTMAEAMTMEDPAAIDEPILRGFRQFADAQGEDRLALAACSQGRSQPLEGFLDRLRLPVLVVAGARDEMVGSPEALAERIPGARGVSIPGCDHFSAIPHALFKAAVFDFLEGWEEDDQARL